MTDDNPYSPPNYSAMRRVSRLNAVLLAFNVLLLLFLVFLGPRLLRDFAVETTPLDGHSDTTEFGRLVSHEQEVAAEMGMHVHCAKNPFIIFVNNNFPSDSSFFLEQYGRALMLSEDDLGGSVKMVDLALGNDFAISCEYCDVGGRCSVRNWRLHHKRQGIREALFDENADGVFDLLSTHNERGDARVYARYDGAWQEVMDGKQDPKQDGLNKRLLGGLQVSFDLSTGQWVAKDGSDLSGTPTSEPTKPPADAK